MVEFPTLRENKFSNSTVGWVDVEFFSANFGNHKVLGVLLLVYIKEY